MHVPYGMYARRAAPTRIPYRYPPPATRYPPPATRHPLPATRYPPPASLGTALQEQVMSLRTPLGSWIDWVKGLHSGMAAWLMD